MKNRDTKKPLLKKEKNKRYTPVAVKYVVSSICAALWTGFSIWVSLPWLYETAHIISFPLALFAITGIAYIPGYINFFMVVSLLWDRQPPLKNNNPSMDITVLIAARNEEKTIGNTIKYLKEQDYSGNIRVLVIDNGSADRTAVTARLAGQEYGMDVEVLREDNPGKFNALNRGLNETNTELVITLDADTILHKSAVRYLAARYVSSPENVCAVAGSVLVRNSRKNLLTRMQEWDYFLGIASIKRLQGLYQGTLVAQGAFSLYKREALLAAGGWPDAIGEDILLTWGMLNRGARVYFEPLSVAFTEVPESLGALSRQRSRWARGMIEALRKYKPWKQPMLYTRYLTGVNLLMPYLDICYTFFWLPGLVLAFFGIYWIVGLMTLLVLPLILICFWSLYLYQKRVFRALNLRVRKNYSGFIMYVLIYQMIMSPASVAGYIQELFGTKRRWK
ncbi:MAG: glycosyltransferase [Clostridiales bacterium]|jgi:biofilm PGA synthesis N-glycosyltransferase PgaC|nr:glycosyltransferase [Clostridiales bacterium]